MLGIKRVLSPPCGFMSRQHDPNHNTNSLAFTLSIMNLPSIVVSAAVLDAAKMCEESRNIELSFSSTPSVNPATYIKTTTSIAMILQPLLQLGCEFFCPPSHPVLQALGLLACFSQAQLTVSFAVRSRHWTSCICWWYSQQLCHLWSYYRLIREKFGWAHQIPMMELLCEHRGGKHTRQMRYLEETSMAALYFLYWSLESEW